MGRGLGRPLRWGSEECDPSIERVTIASEVIEMIGALPTTRQQNQVLGYYARYFLGLHPDYPSNALKPYCIVCETHADRIRTGIKTGGIRKGQDMPSTAETVPDPPRVPSTVPDTPKSYSIASTDAGHTTDIVGETWPGEGPGTPPDAHRTNQPRPRGIEEVYRFAESMADEGSPSFDTLLVADGYGAIKSWYDGMEQRGWTMPDGKPVHNWKSVLIAYANRVHERRGGNNGKQE